MTTRTTSRWMMLLLAGVAVWAQAASMRFVSPPDRNGMTRSAQGEAPWADELAAQWEAAYAELGLYTRTPIQMGFARAFSARFTEASGVAELDFLTGRVSVSVERLAPLSAGAAYEVWLVAQVAGAGNAAGLDLGSTGDRILKLGALSADGSLSASIGAAVLADFPVDMAAVMRVSADSEPEYVIGGMQSIRFQIGREAVSRAPAVSMAGFGGAAPQGGGKKVAALVAQGRELFLAGTFGGNGRTCATCHRLENELTIDIDSVAAMSPKDPLFITDNSPNLPDFDPANPRLPAMEDGGSDGLLRTRALVLENIQGFERGSDGLLVFPPVFRATPSLFNMEFTAPFGLSDCCPDLQTFSAGAVVQHFTRTLARVPGADFVLPTAAELQALEAFQLSNRSPASGNFKISGRNSLLSTAADPRATDTSRSEVRGRDLFLTVGCTTCHEGTVFSGTGTNVNTGVEVLEGSLPGRTPTVDTGDGLGQFQIPPLFGLRKSHFFHTGLVGNNTVVIPGETPQFANLRQAIAFYVGAAFAGSPEGPLFPALLALSDDDLDDIAHFLERISVR